MAESSGQRIKKFRFDVVERVDLLSNEEPNVPPLFREELRNIRRSCALGKISFRVFVITGHRHDGLFQKNLLATG